MPETKTVDLDVPILRGETTINSVAIRKPAAGELRGLQMASLVALDVDSLIVLFPRITTPTLTEHELRNMDVADFGQMAGHVFVFLQPKPKTGDSQTA